MNTSPLLSLFLLGTTAPSLTLVHGFSVPSLLSSCIDACSLGCDEIRSVHSRREATGALKVDHKDARDPKSALTEADESAQQAIVGSLRAAWGEGLRIVGEEDDSVTQNNLPPPIAATGRSRDLLRWDLCRDIPSAFEGTDYDSISISDVTVFVDPLDGTREFVENRLRNCQTLVGVAVRGRAVAGAIGIPFPSGDLTREPTIVYGLVGGGVGSLGSSLSLREVPDGTRPFVGSGDSTHPVMEACREAAIRRGGGRNVLYSGAGHKILGAALGEIDCSIQHKYGGPWDTCAPEAILRAMGGRITDLYGDDLALYGIDASPHCNSLGYLATAPDSAVAHDELCAALHATPLLQQYRERLYDNVVVR